MTCVHGQLQVEATCLTWASLSCSRECFSSAGLRIVTCVPMCAPEMLHECKMPQLDVTLHSRESVTTAELPAAIGASD